MASTASGKGRPAQVGGADIVDHDLLPWPELPNSPLAAVLNEYYWGAGVTGPPAPVQIPYSWITYPLIGQPTPAYTRAAVSQTGGVTSYASAAAATVRRYGAQLFTATLDTDVDADTANLATFVIAYQATPRPRRPVMRIYLHNRTEDECLRILRVGYGMRVQITDAPATWPPGAANITIEGKAHSISVDARYVDWTTTALIGAAPTAPGPWWRWGASRWGGTDIRPF